MPERRTTPRLPLTRPVKLRADQAGFRYLSGRTHNVSANGAMIQLDHPALLLPGQRVECAIAEHPRQGLLRGDALVPATIVRSLRHGESQYIAVRFHQEQPLAAAV